MKEDAVTMTDLCPDDCHCRVRKPVYVATPVGLGCDPTPPRPQRHSCEKRVAKRYGAVVLCLAIVAGGFWWQYQQIKVLNTQVKNITAVLVEMAERASR